jgi:hypothetical protein
VSGQACDFPGCGANTPWTDWTRCERHNGVAVITAENITDEQIRDLLASIPHDGGINAARRDACLVALGLPCPQPHPASGVAPLTREIARARCASLLNAAKEGGK